MAKKQQETVLELPVAFGNISIGDKTARIGINVDRGDMTISQADKNLCEKRLSGKIVSRPTGDHKDQAALPGMEFETALNGVFDVKGFSVSKDALSFGLTFALASIDVSCLAHFAKRSGWLKVNDIEAIPEKESSNGDGEEDEE
jgi:hypothetical protein